MVHIVKNTTLINPLSLLAPHSCRGCGRLGDALCDCCKNYIISSYSNFCPNCKNKTPTGYCKKCNNLPPIYTVNQREGLLDTIIHDYKYHSVRALGLKLAEILDATLPCLPDNTIIVPLPTSTNHIRTRGFDHTLIIAKELAKLRHYKVQPLLLRNKNTAQVGTNRKARLSQARSIYYINPTIKIDPRATYLLLDDVWTTGASMRTAIKLLRSTHIKNLAVSLIAVST